MAASISHLNSLSSIPDSSSAVCIREHRVEVPRPAFLFCILHRGESRHSHLALAYFAGAMLHGGTTPFMRAYAIDWPRCSPACSAIASKRARFVIFEPKKSTITSPSPSGVAAAALRTAANPAFIVEMTFSLPSGQFSTVFRSMFAGVFVPSGSAIRKLSPPMCRNTSHTERTPAPGRHEYFSHGIAFASCVYLPSRPFITWMNAPRQPVVGACAPTGAASDLETTATTTTVNIEPRHVIRGYSGVKDMCVKLRRGV